VDGCAYTLLYIHRHMYCEIVAMVTLCMGTADVDCYTANNLILIRGRKRARYGTELQYQYVQLGQSHCNFVWGLPYSSNRHVTPVSVRGRKGFTCSIRAPPCPRDSAVGVESSPNVFGCVRIP